MIRKTSVALCARPRRDISRDQIAGQRVGYWSIQSELGVAPRRSLESNFMKTPALAELIADCWIKAENDVRKTVARYRDKGEEVITTLLNSDLEREFQKASENRFVEKAFLSD